MLPNDDVPLSTVDAALDVESLDAAIDSLQAKAEVDLTLPRLKLRDPTSLKGLLVAMGMPSAFDPGGADFTAMTAAGGIYIADVVHEAYVEIDEKGTKAAAATAVIGSRLSEPIPEEFHVDRAYMFLIRDDLTGATLFVGRVADPTDAG